MRAREASGAYEKYKGALTPRDVRNPNSYKVRRGKVGGFVDYLSPEDIAYCDEVLKSHNYSEKVAMALGAWTSQTAVNLIGKGL